MAAELGGSRGGGGRGVREDRVSGAGRRSSGRIGGARRQ